MKLEVIKRGIPLAGEEAVNVEDMQSSFDAKALSPISRRGRTGQASLGFQQIGNRGAVMCYHK